MFENYDKQSFYNNITEVLPNPFHSFQTSIAKLGFKQSFRDETSFKIYF